MKRLIMLMALLLTAGLSLFAQIRVACVGDSITYGATLEDRDTQSYPARLQCLLGSGYEVRNFGQSATTLMSRGHRPYIKQETYSRALEFRPDIVVIMLGVNDTDPRDWPDYAEDFVGDYCALVSDFRTVNPEVKVWLCRLTPVFHGHPRFLSGTRDWFAAVQKRIELVASAMDTGLIDLYSPLMVRPDLFSDNLHPDAEGAGIIASEVCSALTGDFGGLKLSPLYCDGMVLQRGKELSFRGTADRGSRIDVRLVQPVQGKRKKDLKENVIACGTADAGCDGRWSVSLPALEAGGPYVLRIGDRSFRDVWVGEVWLCAGQSNMEFKLKSCDTASDDLKEAAVRDDIHIFHMKPRWATDNTEWDAGALSETNALRYYSYEGWKSSDASAAGEFSAVAYHFGRALADSLHCHVGLVSCAVGGSTTESWCDRDLLQWGFPMVLYDWYKGDFGQKWARERALKNIAASPHPERQRHPYETGYLFDSAVRTIDRYPLRGIIWYQGESNAHNIELHSELFPIAVKSWRRYWAEELPVETIQLSAMDRPSWPRFRDSQRILALTVPAVGMTVCSDLGNRTNVHPTAKKPIGERAALSALYNVYGYNNIVPSGPCYKGFVQEGGSLRLQFDWAGGMTVSGGFEVAGSDGIYHEAKASVDGESIVVSSSEVACPVAVRYAWRGFPEGADLRNGAGLPASTFCDEHLLFAR